MLHLWKLIGPPLATLALMGVLLANQRYTLVPLIAILYLGSSDVSMGRYMIERGMQRRTAMIGFVVPGAMLIVAMLLSIALVLAGKTSWTIGVAVMTVLALRLSALPTSIRGHRDLLHIRRAESAEDESSRWVQTRASRPRPGA